VSERVIEDERRLFYVALTRAKQRLAVTASWWYGRDKSPKGPSEFFDDLEVLKDRGLLEVVRRDEQPDENPMFGQMEDRRAWPPIPRIGLEDPLFPEGWGIAGERAVADETTIAALLAAMPADERARADELIAAHERDISVIAEAQRREVPSEPQVPEIISATSFVRLATADIGPWQLARPLPERPTTERRVGTEVHRLIEEKSRGVAPFADEEDLDEPSAVTDPSKVAEYLAHFEASGFGERELAQLPSGELMVELPFTLKRNGRFIRGRIDAVYKTVDGGLEIVDFKTGHRFPVDDEHDQLLVYADALRANGLVAEGQSVTVTYLFLDGEPPLTRVV
jgi:DNA helicase-2/ATP-dependent DNA helicase PcrA